MKFSNLLIAGAVLLGIVYATRPKSEDQTTNAASPQTSGFSQAPAMLSPSSPEVLVTISPEGVRKEQLINSNKSAVEAINMAFTNGQAIQPTGYSGPVRRTPEGYVQREQAAYLGGGKYSVATVTVIPKKTVTIDDGRVTAAGITTHAPVKNAQAIAKYRATRF